MGTAFVGYARVSTLDQKPELQLDALKANGCGKLFVERVSGAKEERRSNRRGKTRFRRSRDELYTLADAPSAPRH